MMLFGPPGCGKTLVARQIGKVEKIETKERFISVPFLHPSAGFAGKGTEDCKWT